MSVKESVVTLWRKRVVRFACVGAINTLTDITILNILVFVLHLNVLVANLISASISITFSYFWNNIIVFQREHKISVNQFVKFAVVTGFSILAVQTLVIAALEHLVSVHTAQNLTGLSKTKATFLQVNIAKLIAVVVSMFWNYVLYHLVVFKNTKEQEDNTDEGVVPY